TLSMLANGYAVRYEPIPYYKRVGRSKIRPTDFFRIFVLISRLMMLFNPSRALFLAGAMALLLGVIDLRYNVAPGDSSIALAGAGGALCLWGVVADRRLRAEIKRDSPSTTGTGSRWRSWSRGDQRDAAPCAHTRAAW